MWIGVSVSALLTEPPSGVSPCAASAAESTFADAVGRQARMIDVNRDLLLLHAVGAQVGDRFDAAQAVAQIVHIPFQFAVGARVRLKVISSAEVSPKSSLVTTAATPAGSCILNAVSPCLIFDQTSSLSFTSSFSSTIT